MVVQGVRCPGRPVHANRAPYHACSANKIMLDLKSMGFEMDFPAMKLKTGSGEAVCRVLVFAADHVRGPPAAVLCT